MKILCGAKEKGTVASITVCILSLILLEFILIYHKPFSLAASVSGNLNRTVVIDAGHGGFDGGTISENGILEKDINLSIAKKTQDMLANMGYNVVMTRSTDTALAHNKKDDMYSRLDIINNSGASLFVSIHQNHYTEQKYYGAQFFYKKDENSKKLAETLKQSFLENIDPQNKRETKEVYSSLFLFNKSKIPCVLCECGFLSNKKEAALLNDASYQTKIAFSIAESIHKYYTN